MTYRLKNRTKTDPWRNHLAQKFNCSCFAARTRVIFLKRTEFHKRLCRRITAYSLAETNLYYVSNYQNRTRDRTLKALSLAVVGRWRCSRCYTSILCFSFISYDVSIGVYLTLKAFDSPALPTAVRCCGCTPRVSCLWIERGWSKHLLSAEFSRTSLLPEAPVTPV